jgi:hypothetical protein
MDNVRSWSDPRSSEPEDSVQTPVTFRARSVSSRWRIDQAAAHRGSVRATSATPCS